MIIGISGKMGSGKDTVGKIIQYLTTDIRHSYRFSDFINPEVNHWMDKNLGSTWEIKKFAGKVKEVCSIITGIPVRDFEKEKVKNSLLGKEWDYLIYDVDDVGIYKQLRVRELLQKVGTDAMRNIVHTNVWVNALFADYIKDVCKHKCKRQTLGDPYSCTSEEECLGESPNWIITDVRFPNEAEAIKQIGGILIRVHRSNMPVSHHISETALDDYKFHIDISNDGTIEDLVTNVQEVTKLLHIWST
jgi:hypothetical protein